MVVRHHLVVEAQGHLRQCDVIGYRGRQPLDITAQLVSEVSHGAAGEGRQAGVVLAQAARAQFPPQGVQGVLPHGAAGAVPLHVGGFTVAEGEHQVGIEADEGIVPVTLHLQAGIEEGGPGQVGHPREDIFRAAGPIQVLDGQP